MSLFSKKEETAECLKKEHIFQGTEYVCSKCGYKARKAFDSCPKCGIKISRVKETDTFFNEMLWLGAFDEYSK